MQGIFGGGGILWIILIGFIAGLVARALKPGKDAMGWILTIVLGIAGALLATFIGRAVGWYDPNEAAGFIGAVIGAIVLLALWGMFSKKKR
ncbi:GlsB/YeaQ/YmgE family stress response membrane protein [Coralloluteibacterium stylophorae]|uniref:GlsB/YeaQ/YmgE family stress response membrane protein n=2 Tax=Coralloluteibacterium stylophorae TaxID=1776034 RepID=A0AAP2FY55_9GAMM|nr:GlsB/YeaQ/YmgE family stress response membrane protein [Coralloluteibacterium stylophorae]MBS7456722.1 GlsB/YeaQ/YmgE family stress response membrane protein [Coralloluteibacterium stylophorae]